MSTFVKKYPVISLLVLALIFGTAPALIVATGLLSPAWTQLGAFSSSLAAIVLVVIEGRKGGLRELLSRILIWRVGIQWWAFALFFMIVPSVASLYLFNLLGGPAVDWSGLRPLYTVVPMFIFLTIAAGIGEEFGWRGFLLPRLQTRYNALSSGLIVGVAWAIWHIPLFFIKGTSQYEQQLEGGLLPAILGYAVFVIAQSVQFTWLFNNTKGSVLLAAVFHGASNTWAGYIDVYRGHFGGILTVVAVSVLVTLIIVLMAGPRDLSRTDKRNVLEMIKKPLAIVLTLVLLLPHVAPAIAQENKVAPGGNVSTTLAQQHGPIDPAELEAFLDDLLAKEMDENHIPGAVISVVKDGKVFFTKGYGYADLENKIPIDPEQTVFKIGSVGKLFTWTAVMQLVEQGKLDLDADINTSLDFHIPDTYPEPITLKHLLTHTAGFEDLWFEVFVWHAEDLTPPGEWLASHIPARVRPPGSAAAYSNYGADLAGYIVARASGQPYEQYLQDYIFTPLGMTHSSAQWPLPEDQHTSVSLGYWDVGAGLQPVPDYPQYIGQPAMLPAGAHSSSATDMARFMIAHLANGHYSGANIPEALILKEATAQQMHSTLYTPDPRILGNAYGFFEFNDNSQRVLGHSGGTLGFTTLLLLLPDQDLGVFVAYNNESGGGLTTQHFGFQRAFFDHYYPAPAVEPIQPPVDFAERAGQFVGAYRATRSPYTTLEKIGNLMIPPVVISDPGDGALLLTVNGIEMRLVEVKPLYFRQPDGRFGIVFREDNRGQVTHMFADVSPQYAYEKIDWYERPGFNLILLLSCVLLFLSMLPVAVIRFIQERRLSRNQKPASRSARMAYWIILAISLLNLLFVIGAWQMLTSLGFPRFGVSLIDRIVLGLGVFAAVLTVGALIYAALAWKDRYWGGVFRVYYTLVTIAAVAFVWFLNQWNLLGWRF